MPQTIANPITPAANAIGDAIDLCRAALARVESEYASLCEAVAYASRPPSPPQWPAADRCVYEIETNACGCCGAVRILPPGATPGHGEYIWGCGWRDVPTDPGTVELTLIQGRVPTLAYFVEISERFMAMGRTHIHSLRSKAGGRREWTRKHEIRPWVEAWRRRQGAAGVA